MHHLHKFIDIMEVMEDSALHKNHIKGLCIFRKIDLQDITDFIMEDDFCGLCCLHRIALVCFGYIKHRNIRAKQSQRNRFLAAGTTDIGDLYAIEPVEIIRVLSEHLPRIRRPDCFSSSFALSSGVPSCLTQKAYASYSHAFLCCSL